MDDESSRIDIVRTIQQLVTGKIDLDQDRIRISTLLLEGNALLSIEKRIARRLLLLAEDALQGNIDQPRYHLRLSQESLAQMLGASRQSINKVLRNWKRNGMIDLHYEGITLCDFDGLKRLSMPD